MQKNIPDHYEFAGIRLFTIKPQLEILATSKIFAPSKNHYGILLTLAENAPSTVSYEKLWKEVWLSEHYDESSRHTIQTTKGQLVSWLKTIGIADSPIVTNPGKGYFLALCAVGASDEATSIDLDRENNPNLVNFAARPENVKTEGSHEVEANYTSSGVKFSLNWKFVSGIVVLALIFMLMWRNSTSPRLEKTEFISKPVPGKEFYLRLSGKDFNAETVRLKVAGPGCGGDDPCTVKNGDLRLYGQITNLVIEKAPLTLRGGDYHLWLENELGNGSNKLKITVPDTRQE